MKRLPVHCCCNPERLFGYLDVPEERCYEGSRYQVPLMKAFEWADPTSYAAAPWREGSEYITIEIDKLTLTVSGFVGAQSFLAVKSNDIPIETFRMLPGFAELR